MQMTHNIENSKWQRNDTNGTSSTQVTAQKFTIHKQCSAVQSNLQTTQMVGVQSKSQRRNSQNAETMQNSAKQCNDADMQADAADSTSFFLHTCQCPSAVSKNGVPSHLTPCGASVPARFLLHPISLASLSIQHLSQQCAEYPPSECTCNSHTGFAHSPSRLRRNLPHNL
jgi:hypothetical protein